MALWTSAPFFVIKIGLSAGAVAWALARPRWLTLARYKEVAPLAGVSFKTAFVRQKNAPGYTMYRSELPALAGVMFDLNRENWWDKFFKQRGLVTEPQVGRPTFDEAFYIRSDSPSFKQALASSDGVRAAIEALFGHAATWLTLEDGLLRVRLKGDQRENQTALAAFAQLHQVISVLGPRLVPGDDRFLQTIRWLRALLWGCVPFGVLSLMELTTPRLGFVHIQDLLRLGFYVTVPALLLFCVGLVRFMKESSRAPRLLTEFGLILILAALPAGVGLIADLDRYLDRRPELVVERVVRSTRVHEYRTKNGMHHDYFGCFDPAALAGRGGEAAKFELPDCLQLTNDEYSDLRQGDAVRFHVGRGLFGIPWYKRLQRLER